MVQHSIHYSGSKSFKLWGIFPQNSWCKNKEWNKISIYFHAQTQKVKHSIPRIPQTQFWIYSSDNLYIESMRFFKILIDLKCVWNKFDKNFIFGIWRWNSNPKHWSQYNTHFIIVFSDVRTLPMGSFIKHVYKAGGGGGFPNVHITTYDLFSKMI